MLLESFREHDVQPHRVQELQRDFVNGPDDGATGRFLPVRTKANHVVGIFNYISKAHNIT